MKNDVMYKKCAQSKVKPLGIEEIQSLNGNSPIFFTLIAMATTDRSINGAAKTAGSASGFNDTSIDELLFENIPQYSWQDIDNTNIQYVSTSSRSNIKIVFEKYFKPLLYDGIKIKSYDDLLIILRNINIMSYCAATNDIKKFQSCFNDELSKNFSKKEVNLLMRQIVAIDVTTRIALDFDNKNDDHSKFTIIHIFSKEDDELANENYDLIHGEKGLQAGVYTMSESEAVLVVDRLLITEGSDHTFADFFKTNSNNKTVQGQAFSLLINLLVSDTLNSSLKHQSLSNNSLQMLSGIFIPENIALFDELIKSQNLSTENLSVSLLAKKLTEAREKNQEIMKVKLIKTLDEINNDKETNLFYKKYAKTKCQCEELIVTYSQFVENYSKFEQSEEFKKLSEFQKVMFKTVFQNIVNNIKSIEYTIKRLDGSISNVSDIDKLGPTIEKVKQNEIFLKFNRVLTCFLAYSVPCESSGNFKSVEEQKNYFRKAYKSALEEAAEIFNENRKETETFIDM